MSTIRLELDINIEDSEAALYQKVSKDVKPQLSLVVSRWLKKYLERLETKPQVDSDWLEFLDNIDKYAVDTGIEDLSINHEYYLYGGPKRQ